MAERTITTTEEEELAIAFAESRGSTFESSVKALLASWIHTRGLAAKARAAEITDKLVCKQPLMPEEKVEMQSLLDTATIVKTEEGDIVTKG